MSLQTMLMAVALGLGAMVFSMHGQGGGVLYAPIQVLFGTEFHDAALRSEFLIMVTAISATFVFRAADRVDWALASVLEIFTVVGAYWGGTMAHQYSARFLTILLATIVLAAALLMMLNAKAAKPLGVECNRWFIWRRRLGDDTYCANLLLAAPATFTIGVLSGLTGTAGGFLKVPLLTLLIGMPVSAALGTTSFMISLTAMGGFAGHMRNLSPDWSVLGVLTLFVLLGAQIGPRIALQTDEATTRRRFSLFLLIIGSITLVLAFTQ